MTSYTASWLLLLLSTLIPFSAACNSTVSCVCGSSDKNYTLCIDDVRNEGEPCDIWSHCSTCQDSVAQCVTCPENRTGPTCMEDCGRTLLQPSPKIGMSRVVAGEWPWTVAIASTRENVTNIICTGVLLSRHTVRTVAHCVVDNPPYTLYFGKYYRRDRYDDEKVIKRLTSRIVIHQDFHNVNLENDIALLRFEPSVRYSDRIQPICLPTPSSTAANLIPGKRGYVTGWGMNEMALLSNELKAAHVPVQPDDKCRGDYEELGIEPDIHPAMFCAGFTEGLVGICRGDTGSPLVFLDRKTESHTVEGLASYGQRSKRCGDEEAYTVFTKVAHYMPWILKNLN